MHLALDCTNTCSCMCEREEINLSLLLIFCLNGGLMSDYFMQVIPNSDIAWSLGNPVCALHTHGFLADVDCLDPVFPHHSYHHF